MKNPVDKFYQFVPRPIYPAARILLLLAIIPLVLSFFFPLWRISLSAPQYPDGLHVDVYSYALRGGNNGQHLTEINTINHYIGMHRIDRSTLTDLDWMPFAIGILGLLAMRVALIGDVRALIDLSVLSVYVSGFAFARFFVKMYSMGHDLDPEAPLHIPPFTPPVFGSREIANFTSSSYPNVGSIFLGAFLFVVIGVTVWHLIRGRIDAAREEKKSAAAPPSATGPAVATVAVLFAVAAMACPRAASACDVCGMGDALPAADPSLTITGTDTPSAGHVRVTAESATSLRRIGTPGIDRQELFDSRVAFGAAWTPLRALTVSAMIPVVYRSYTDTANYNHWAFGLGDAQASVRVYVFRDDRWIASTAVSFSAGVKMPTAPTLTSGNGRALASYVQTGTGSWDPFVGATFTRFGTQWSFIANARLVWPTTGRDGYLVGRAVTLSVAPQYRILPKVAVMVSLDAWAGEPDRDGQGVAANTGGVALFTSPTVLVNVTPSLLLRATLQIPVAAAYIGVQRDSPAAILAGTYTF